MQIIKRDGSYQEYSSEKISNAIKKAFSAEEKSISENELKDIIFSIENEIDFRLDRNEPITVEWIQDRVEIELMKREHFAEVRSYILYREGHTKTREAINGIVEIAGDKNLVPVLRKIQTDFKNDVYDLGILLQKYKLLSKEGMNKEYALDVLIRSAEELISKEAPKYEYIAGRLLSYKINTQIDNKMNSLGIDNFYDKLVYLAIENISGSYIVDNYKAEEIKELGEYIKSERDELLTFAGLDCILQQYLLKSPEHGLIEKPQEMYMEVAMHLAIKESDKLSWAKTFYDMLSTQKLVLASSTMINARKINHQMSSSFVDTVPNSISGIYKTLENYSAIAKNSGGFGFYFGKVKANENGTIRWIKLINDTASGIKKDDNKNNACAVYLDVWHKDLPEFLELKSLENKDNYKEILPAVCYPNLFWKMAKDNINDTWYLMCPQQIREVKGYSLEDYYGKEWEQKYFDCVKDERISKRGIAVKEVIRLILKSVIDTGTPFTFNRDLVNEANPNKHKGIIYCSNLCTEIAQNMSSVDHLDQEIIKDDEGNMIVVEKYKAGNYVANNLGSINLGAFDVNDNRELKDVIDASVRALDNIIDLNEYAIPYTYISNKEYRAIGLGVLGYQHALAKNGIKFESDEHLKFADNLFEKINFFAINASSSLAKEKGSYSYFEGSDYQTGEYFDLRNYHDEKWDKLSSKVKQYGLRNGYLLAISPNSLTSVIAGTTKGIEPIYNKLYTEHRNKSLITRVAPELNQKTYWLYKNAHAIDQTWSIKACGIRQRHIDQSQAITLYITNEYTYRQLLSLYILAYEMGVKTIHYVRSKNVNA